MTSEHHTWTVDEIEEHMAAIEVDGKGVTHLPEWVLPAGVKEGDVLRVRHERLKTRSVLTIEIDREATARLLEQSAKQVTKGKSRDPAGDIVL
jgi:Protein of unknown function (DUF3006)